MRRYGIVSPWRLGPSAFTHNETNMVDQYSQQVTALNGGLHPTRPQRGMCFYNKTKQIQTNYEAQASLRATTQAQSQTDDKFTCLQPRTQNTSKPRYSRWPLVDMPKKPKLIKPMQQTVARTIFTRRPKQETQHKTTWFPQEIDCRRSPELDVHNTKTQRRERSGADDIHHESSGRRTPQ